MSATTRKLARLLSSPTVCAFRVAICLVEAWSSALRVAPSSVPDCTTPDFAWKALMAPSVPGPN
jgi:hypothetical protein